MSDIIFIPASSAPEIGGLGSWPGDTYEYINKNIRAYDSTLSYITNKLTSIVYDLGGGMSITKTFSYTGNTLDSVILSGDTPLGIPLTKTLTYTVNNLTGVTYS